MSILPWPDMLRAASALGILPAAFWAMSVREWRGLQGDSKGLDGARLADLIAAFPDEEETSK